MEAIKKVLDALNSALSELIAKIAKADDTVKSYTTQKMKLDEKTTELEKKAEDLNVREGKIKHIESIVDATENAKKLAKEAKALMDNANERQAILEKGLKDLGIQKAKFEEDMKAEKEANKKQVEALKEERKEFEGKVKAYKAVAAAVK